MSKIPLEAIKAAQNSLRHDYVHADNKTVARALEAADGARAQGAEVAVKPLEWKPYRNGDAGAVSIFGHIYTAYAEGLWLLTKDGKSGKFNRAGTNLKAAKAAASADYEQRIRAALTTPPAPQPTERERVLENALRRLEEGLSLGRMEFRTKMRCDDFIRRASEARAVLEAGEA